MSPLRCTEPYTDCTAGRCCIPMGVPVMNASLLMRLDLCGPCPSRLPRSSSASQHGAIKTTTPSSGLTGLSGPSPPCAKALAAHLQRQNQSTLTNHQRWPNLCIYSADAMDINDGKSSLHSKASVSATWQQACLCTAASAMLANARHALCRSLGLGSAVVSAPGHYTLMRQTSTSTV